MRRDLVKANAVEGELEPVEGQRERLFGGHVLLERELHHRPHFLRELLPRLPDGRGQRRVLGNRLRSGLAVSVLVSGFGFRVLVSCFVFRAEGFGFGFRAEDFGFDFWVEGLGVGVQGLELRVWSLGLVCGVEVETLSTTAPKPSIATWCTLYGLLIMVYILWFEVQGLGFRVQGSGFSVYSLRFRVQGLGLRMPGFGFLVYGLRIRV